MGGVLIMSAIAAAGVLLAGIAIAIPKGNEARDEQARWDGAVPQGLSLRDRINQPFQAIADRTPRQRRLNGGLSLAEQLARADLKLRTAEFVMLQVGLMVLAALLS